MPDKKISIGISMKTEMSSLGAMGALNRNLSPENRNTSHFKIGIKYIEDGFNNDDDNEKANAAYIKYLVKKFFEQYDGLVVPGNNDNIHPYFFQPGITNPGYSNSKFRRMHLENALIKEALVRGIPALGICGGHQAIGAVLGAKIDSVKKLKNKLPIRESIINNKSRSNNPATFPVAYHANSALRTIINKDFSKTDDIIEHEVSCHTQAINPDEMPSILVISASDDEGIVKGVEVNGHPWMLGTQFHPEFFSPGSDANNAIFSDFIAACHTVKEQKILKQAMHEELKSITPDQITDTSNKYHLLLELANIVNDPKWIGKGNKLYSFIIAVLPDGFKQLKKDLEHLDKIKDNISEINKLFKNTHDLLDKKSQPYHGFGKRNVEVQEIWTTYKNKFDDLISPEVKVKANLKPIK